MSALRFFLSSLLSLPPGLPANLSRSFNAASAVALWSTLAERLGLADVVVRTSESPAPGFHPTRCARLVDRGSGAVLGTVGEVDALLVEDVATTTSFGPRIHALAIYLKGFQARSYERLSGLFPDAFGLSVSEGAAQTNAPHSSLR